jgi:hypothetical protein
VIMALGASRSQDDDSRAPSMSDQIRRHKRARFAACTVRIGLWTRNGLPIPWGGRSRFRPGSSALRRSNVCELLLRRKFLGCAGLRKTRVR